MTTIHGELSADSKHIVVMAAGADPYELAFDQNRLAGLTPLIRKSADVFGSPGALVIDPTWPAVVQLGSTFGEQWVPGPKLRAWATEEAMRRTSLTPIEYRPPSPITPYQWQLEGAALIAATGRALITDEPRVGKTATAILGLCELLTGSPDDPSDFRGPVVVICPASVVDPWVEAWENWAPHCRTVAWRGPKRKSLLGTADVYVTSWDTARVDAPPAGTKEMRPLTEGIKPVAVIWDECHYAKNSTAKRSQAATRIAKVATSQDGSFVALSGTPITKDTGDLFSTLRAMEPDAYPDKSRWINRYCDTIREDYDEEIVGLNRYAEPEFRLSMLGQHRRVTRAEVMSHLPPKIHSIRTVELPKEWRKVYDDFEEQMLAELPDGQELSVMDTLSKLTHLSSLASAAADVRIEYGPDLDKDTGEPKRHVHVDLKAPSWKVDALLEILEERPGEKVVVFAPSRQLIELAGRAILDAKLPGFPEVGWIVGKQSPKVRTGYRTRFQEGDLSLLCATTSAGGTGITLSKAGTLVFLQRPWSLVDTIQSEDRAEGDMEATRGTEIIDVIASNTIESRVRAALKNKGKQLAELVQDPKLMAELLGGANVTRHKEAS